MDENRDELVSQFCGITGAQHQVAIGILASADWNLVEAVRLYYESQEGAEEEPAEEPEVDMDDNEPTSRPGNPSGSGSSRPPRAGQQGRLRTIRDLQGGGAAGDDSDESDDDRQDFFAGGEKSGLAVQNPNNNRNPDHFNNIINQARQHRPRPGGEDEPERPSYFQGPAQTLGGDDAPSRLVEDPTAARPSALPRVTRTLHLWQDGFSVDDGPLYRFDDPANGPTLALINQGRAPLALLGVEPGQEVDLNLNPHKDEKYKRKWKAFGGEGQRLGSPTPGPAPTAAPAAPAAAPTPAPATAAPTVSVDASLPTLLMQIRLGDGTRLSQRFNTTHTVGDVYAFVDASNATGRAYVLMTTFPNKEYGDKTLSLGDEFGKGGMLIQKWT